MPFTPYHFGINAFFGLVFRKYLDLPIIVLGNVIADIEVLFIQSYPVHRYVHTFLLGGLIGGLFGLAAYPFRKWLKKLMNLFQLDYQPTLLKMVFSGILGIWLHILVDAVVHWDVFIFWPAKSRPLFKFLSPNTLMTVLILFWIGSIIIYLGIIRHKKRRPSAHSENR